MASGSEKFQQQVSRSKGGGGGYANSPARNHHQLLDTVEVLDKRQDNVNGKQIIVRTTTSIISGGSSPPLQRSHHNSHGHIPTRTRSSSLSGRSLRRRIVSDPKYHRLESNKALNGRVDLGNSRIDDDYSINSAKSLMKQQQHTTKKSSVLSMSEIIDSVKRGMSTFSLPRISKNKGSKRNGIDAGNEDNVDVANIENNRVHTNNHNEKEKKIFWDKGRRKSGLIISASTTDIRSVYTDSRSSNAALSDPKDLVRDPSTREGSPGGNSTGSGGNKSRVPGITGIRNHGNTCYMNAVLQCLCHTDNMARYFVMDRYKIDLSRRNKYNSKKYGTRGEVTEQLALLFKSLWSSQYTPDISNQFRNVVGKYASQYQSGNQQDAQEFLLWLLDKVHEDLNTATKKKYKKIGSTIDRSEEDIAAEALANYTRCNNSFVHDLFQAQYRSTLTCPACEKQSITFDPFLCISIPIPQRQFRPIFATVVYQDQNPKEVKIGLRINTEANIRELKEAVATDTSIPEAQIILIELYQDNFGRILKDSDHISTIQDTPIYAIETPPTKDINSSAEEHLLILCLNKLGYGNNAKRFGGPFAINVHREVSYCELQAAVFRGMSNIMKNDVLDRDHKELDSIIRFRVVDGIPGKCYLPDDVQLPLYMPTVDQAISNNVDIDGERYAYLKISVEWDTEVQERRVKCLDEIVEEHHSVSDVKNQQNISIAATLFDCFNLYTQEEKLELENKWLCPGCKRPQQGVKKLSLWTLPDILVIHLKRFRQTNTQRTKLDTLVDFPIQDLNMSSHIVNRNQNDHLNTTGILHHWSPWKQHHRPPLYRPDNHVYDLYAICNHHGSMQSGHYTAYCKNPIDGLWYHFDDTTVRKVEESQIATTSAYILFYQRRSHSSGGSSSESSSCATWPDHWAYNMPNFHFIPPKTSKSHDNLCDLDYTASRSINGTMKERSFLRGGRKYSTFGHLPGRRHNPHKQVENIRKEAEESASEQEKDSPTPANMPESRV